MMAYIASNAHKNDPGPKYQVTKLNGKWTVIDTEDDLTVYTSPYYYAAQEAAAKLNKEIHG